MHHIAPASSRLLRTGSRRAGVFAVLLATLSAGCGSETYQSRLDETVRYFDYVDRLNTNLSLVWPGPGVTWRVPKQFGKALTQPAATPGPDGNLVQPPDTRQPDYINLTLPGLLGAWRGKIAVNGKTELMPCHLYALSNYSLWTNPATREAAPQFHGHVVEQLLAALQMSPPPESQWQVEKFPPVNGYATSRAYRSIRLSPEAPVLGNSKTTFALYLYQTGDIQVAILLVVPNGVADREKLGERMALSLETLNVANQTPGVAAPTAAGGAPGGAPAQPKPSTPQF